MKIYHRSRKFLIIMLGLVFLNSVVTLKLRSYQRKQNLAMIKTELRNKYPEQLFNYIEEKSKREDLYLLIGTNVVVLTIILGFDRFGVFEETDDTIKANKEKIKKGIGIFI
nr:MAG TPA: hypothetical protein [Caudoviricetes sp.]